MSNIISGLEGDAKAYIGSALTKLKTMFDNAVNSWSSHIPTFTDEELNYLENDAATELHIPQVWIDVAKTENMKLEQITDPAEVAFLNNLKALIDEKLAEVIPATGSAVTSTVSVTTSAAEKATVADAVVEKAAAKVEPAPQPEPAAEPEAKTDG